MNRLPNRVTWGAGIKKLGTGLVQPHCVVE